MSDIETLIKSQMSLRDQMQKFVSNTKKTNSSKRTHGFYVGRLNGWHDLWTQFTANEEKITQLKKIKDLELSYFKDDIFSELEQFYYETKGELVDQVEKLARSSAEGAHTSSDNPGNISLIRDTQQSARINLPKITLPQFSGNYSEWTSFRDLFTSVIHQNSSLDDVQRLHYLKSTVKDEAAQVINQFTLTSANYNSAWATLKQRYENKRVIVSTLLKAFVFHPKIHSETAGGIKKLLDVTTDCLASLSNLDINTLHWDPLLIQIITHKLPIETRKDWEESIGDSSALPSWQDLKKFLELRFRTLEAISGIKPAPHDKKSEPPVSKTNIHAFHTAKIMCHLCNKNHSLLSCPNFLKLETANRWQLAKSKGWCTNCLGRYHSNNKCLSKTRCSKCGAKHHSLLHKISSPVNLAKTAATEHCVGVELPTANEYKNSDKHNSAQASTSNILSHFTSEKRNILLATAVIYIKTAAGLQVARAMVDPGSQATFITTSALRSMNLNPNKNISVKVTGIGNKEMINAHKIAHLFITTMDGKTDIEVDAIVLDTLTATLPPNPISLTEWKNLQGLKLADPAFFKPNQIDVLIGADIYPRIVLNGVKRINNGSVLAQNTIFGWILSGQIFHEPLTRLPEIISLTTTTELNSTLKAFWEIEEIPERKTESAEDTLCETLYKETHSRKSNGSYVVRLPLKSNNASGIVLGSSRNIALKRYLSMERSAERRGILDEYNQVIKEYLTSGHMEPVKHLSNPLNGIKGVNYLPHHAVLKASSTTTKLRVVFDASCKTTSEKSLNDILLTGPTLQRDITSIIMKWRCQKYVFSADIEKMYRQIWVHPDDADFQRILWRPESEGQIRDYRLLTVTFGVSSAPYLAIRTLHQLAEDERSNFPSAAKCLENDFYVDDVLTGANTLDEVNNLKEELINLLQKGNFHLRKFSANHPDILKSLPRADISDEILLSFPTNMVIKTLGIFWDPSTDTFQYKLNLDLVSCNTKRSALSQIAKLYDPLGWISPIVISAKIFMQKLWLSGLDWDESLPKGHNDEWEAYITALKRIEEIRIPRWIPALSTELFEVHGFCDSSERAYAAAIYIKGQTEDGRAVTQLVISKTKVAPLKSRSLPQLELCGAHLLSKLIHSVKQSQFQNSKTVLWTDSTIVLTWLRNQPSKWKTFVANRVSDIQLLTESCAWRHVPSRYNPADLASRGISPSELIQNDLWWNGPRWLREDKSMWPTMPNISDDSEEELRHTKVYTAEVIHETLVERFSNLNRACRVIAYCRRFADRLILRKKDSSKGKTLAPEEIENAKHILIKESQRTFYSREIEALSRTGKIDNTSPLSSLNPFLDEQKILRVGGRLEHSNLSFDEKHPIILARSSHLTTLILNHIHRITLHGRMNLMLYTLRKTYWIPAIKALIRKIIHHCVTCTRWKAQTPTQIMGNLPSTRIIPDRPFANVGIDFAGPLHIKLNKTRTAKTCKAYIAIFVCFAIKAIHIELVSDLTAEAFIAALRRFFARRGLSKNIYSDNGTNFVGASRILEKEFQEAIISNQKDAAEYYACENIKWHFNPPNAPHFGGLWEAGVKSIKFHLRRTLGQAILTYEELTTVLTQIEAVLNSRPLCPATTNIDDLNPITPGHFLIGDSLLSLPETDLTNYNPGRLTRWKFLQQLKQHFWKRWLSEYLSRLQQRPKWKSEEKSLNIGDLVLLKEGNVSPSCWKLARIIEVHPGTDKQVRVVVVKTSSTTLKRPISQLCPLPFQN